MKRYIMFNIEVSVNPKRLQRLLKHYIIEKKCGGRKNTLKPALTYEQIREVVAFLINYLEEHALHLPGRVPGYRKDDITLLPISHTKTVVYKTYKNSFEGTGAPSKEIEERAEYQRMTKEAKDVCHQLGVHSLQRSAPNSRPVSMHYSFDMLSKFTCRHYGLGETSVHLHCDNCSDQNKNRFMLWYLAWSNQVAPDWCFGLLKQAFRRNAV
ncbi:hypothetical protein CAPTEDRAFT_215576 [Capitella teleta]|uniref:Uncharacterized protein n=1 Tax=Capitella teleta TaxID=283909 RepID=R7UG61_CAPTE|nr:hypothetical protein CAPTEDRAFT_215576 [Capitella teleta]|eukprot:ELU02793.1 hypothetical protein CAPTEDRAFT_215576 [Capitella teleta]